MKLFNKFKILFYRENKKKKEEEKKKKLQELLIIIPFLALNKTSKQKPVKEIKLNKKEITKLKEKKKTPKKKEIIIEDKPKEENITEITKLDEETKSKELEKYTSYKIVEEYSKRLKDIRYDLREIDTEFKEIEDNTKSTYNKEEIDKIMNNLNILTRKIDELKKKLEVPNKYDDKYIYDLVQNYIKEFNNQNVVKEIKSSPLYIEISNRINSLLKVKDNLKTNVNNKSNEINTNKKNIDSIRSKYEGLKSKSDKISSFESAASEELSNLQDLVKNATSIKEKTLVRVRKAHNLSNLLLAIIATDLVLNPRKSARRMAVEVAVGVYLINRIMNDRYTIREDIKYEIKDYREKIKKGINSIKDASKSLEKTSDEIKKLISELNSNYKDYSDDPDYKSLLNNLETIDSNIDEKRYQIDNIRSREESLLSEHTSKIKTLNN